MYMHCIYPCFPGLLHWYCSASDVTLKAHLHYIRDLGPSIRVRARTQSKQVNWCFVFTLIRVRVRDFCLGRPCPSSSLHLAISSDTDVRGCAIRMLKAAWARGRYCRLPKWPWPRITSDPSLGCSVNKTRSGARTLTRTRMLGQCKCKCALMNIGEINLYQRIIISSYMKESRLRLWRMTVQSIKRLP